MRESAAGGGKDSIQDGGRHDDVVNAIAGVINVIIAKPVMSTNSVPIGVGRGIGCELKKLSGGSILSKRSPFRDIGDEPPAKVHEVFRFRWGWGTDE